LILSHLAGRTDHPTADAVLRALRLDGHDLGPATLYQNLGKLAEAGLVARISGPDGLMHFDPTVEAHPHMTCRRCGKIVDAQVEADLVERLTPRCPHSGRSLSDWQVEGVDLELRGVCPACLARR
jgi:Fur family peroxide stress response transcriptional regulator